MREKLEEFRKGLPFAFNDIGLLEKVFVHRSYLNEKEGSLESNERLEFLGDAILSNIISHLLFERYPDIDEGELTRLRAKLVNRHTLAKLANRLRLNDYLFLGKGERASGGSANPTILAGVFEALIAAAYFEAGFKETFKYVESLFSDLIDESLAGEPGHFDFKPRLQELTQRLFKEAPVYKIIREDGPAHKKLFEVVVIVRGKALGTGAAPKKKEAEQIAAGEALKKIISIQKGLGDGECQEKPAL